MGEKLNASIESAPEVMAELMREFIENREQVARCRVRLRIKALLDFLSVDTIFQPNPLVNKGKVNGPAQMNMQSPVVSDADGVFSGAGFGGVPVAMASAVPIPAAAPIPGVQVLDNSDIFG